MTDTNKVLRQEIRKLRAENIVLRRQLARHFTYPETRRLLRTGQMHSDWYSYVSILAEPNYRRGN